MKQFEYKFFELPYYSSIQKRVWAEMETFMNNLDSEGWEVLQRDVRITDINSSKMTMVVFCKREVLK